MHSRMKHSPKRYSGKSNAASSSKHRETKSAGDTYQFVEDKEITLPDLKMVDIDKHLQTYKSVLARPRDEGITMDDLDKLQMELEMMLSNVVLRQRTLHAEIGQISMAEEMKSKRSAGMSVLRLKKHKKHEDKTDSDNVDTDNADESNSICKDTDQEDSLDELKEFSSRYPPKRTIPLVPPSVVPISRNDITNKFWAMIEPYCAEITIDDVKFLEDLVKSYDVYERDDFKKVPPLGTHYSLRWTRKDFKEEKDISSWSKSEIDSDAADAKNSDPITPNVGMPGPMVQRLVSALVEENPLPSAGLIKRGLVDNDENYGPPLLKKSKDLGLNGFISTNGEYSDQDRNYRLLPLYHTSQCFEEKVRKELEEIGFLEPANENNEDVSDEVLAELKRCQSELQSVATKNKKILQHLLQVVKTEFKRQQIKNQIKVVNSELADINLRNIQLKLKKKHLCKKEAEDAWKLLKQREALLIDLEEIS